MQHTNRLRGRVVSSGITPVRILSLYSDLIAPASLVPCGTRAFRKRVVELLMFGSLPFSAQFQFVIVCRPQNVKPRKWPRRWKLRRKLWTKRPERRRTQSPHWYHRCCIHHCHQGRQSVQPRAGSSAYPASKLGTGVSVDTGSIASDIESKSQYSVRKVS